MPEIEKPFRKTGDAAISESPLHPRRKSRRIMVGPVPVGGGAPISVQSMTNTLTADVPATLQQIAELTAAGCDIVTTNTFGATAAHLGADAASCMRASVRIAREAVLRAGRGYVAADMGPSGRLLAPYGDLLFEDAIRLFQDGFAAAIEEGPDLLLIETMTDLAEVKACVLGAKQALKAAAKDRGVPKSELYKFTLQDK